MQWQMCSSHKSPTHDCQEFTLISVCLLCSISCPFAAASSTDHGCVWEQLSSGVNLESKRAGHMFACNPSALLTYVRYVIHTLFQTGSCQYFPNHNLAALLMPVDGTFMRLLSTGCRGGGDHRNGCCCSLHTQGAPEGHQCSNA